MTDTHTTFPNKFEAFVLVAVLFAVEMVLSIALSEASLLDDIDWQGASGFVTVVGNGVLFIFLMAYKRLNYRALFHPTANSVAGTVGALILPVLMIVPGVSFLTGLLNLLVQSVLPLSAEDEAMFADMLEIGAVPIFFTCVAAPLLEEMLFRGVILRSFLHQYSRKQAIVWSALIFGLAHLNAYQCVTAFILGLVLGWLYERTRSLWPSILLHAAFNGYVTFSARGAESGEGGFTAAGLAMMILCAIAGALMLFHALEPVDASEQESDRNSE
jgi:membrane protease YdiL (CAAX protease family)